MIKLTDIKLAINKLIYNELGIEVTSNTVKDSFSVPAIFTSIEPINYEHLTENIEQQYLMCIVHYFPSKGEGDLDLLEMSERLKRIFNMKLKVKDRYLNVENIRESIVDDTLMFKFNLFYYQDKGRVEEGEKMQEIIIERNDV